MRRFSKGRGGTVLAFFLGLLIATAGTAGAAKLITGKQIKDGSISARDLNKAVRDQLAKAGAPGPAGAKGDTGAKGETGATGAKGETGPSVGAPVAGKFIPKAEWSDVLTISGLGVLQAKCPDVANVPAEIRWKNTSPSTQRGYLITSQNGFDGLSDVPVDAAYSIFVESGVPEFNGGPYKFEGQFVSFEEEPVRGMTVFGALRGPGGAVDQCFVEAQAMTSAT